MGRCSVHTDARFLPYVGCAECNAGPPAPDAPTEPGPNERAQVEAIARGLADGLEWEKRTAGTWESAKREEKTCRGLRAMCTKRGKGILRGDVELTPEIRGENVIPVDEDREARAWFDLAAKFTGHLLKAQDVQVKAGKLTSIPAAQRDSDALIEKQNNQGIAAKAKQAKGGN